MVDSPDPAGQPRRSAAGQPPRSAPDQPRSDPDDLPRPLSDAERDALLAILGARTFPGRDALRAQVETAEVVGYCGCGCASVDLRVADEAQRAAEGTPSPIPNEATVIGEDGEAVGGVIVFAGDGRLSLLEVYSYEDEPIRAFPPLARLVLA